MKADDSKIISICLVMLTIFATTGFLYFTRPILVPFVISIFFYVVTSPAVTWFQKKWKLNKSLAVLLTIVIFLTFSVCLFALMSISIREFVRDTHIYRNRVIEFFVWFGEQAAHWNIQIDDQSLLQEIKRLPLLDYLKNITGSVVTILGNTVLIIVFVLFMLAGERVGQIHNPMMEEVLLKISKYVTTKFFMAGVTGLLTGVVLLACQADLTFMFVILTILLNLIPSVGAIIATALPLPVVLLQYGMGWQFVVVTICVGVIHFVIGNIFEPKLLGESMDLHPVTILIFLVFWGLVWGIPGMFLAVPITAVLRIVLGRIEVTKSWADILAGRLSSLK